ncbi:MAG: SPOR domain-containing protein [Bacteroidota bacterium]|nr:SPOR domain-containing protein [Bacteroidota bacterium]
MPEEKSKLEPFSKKPKRDISLLKYFFIGLSIIIVVSSIIFLVYIFSLRQPETIQQAKEMVQQPTLDTSIIVISTPPEKAIEVGAPISKAEEDRLIPRAYCVYIAAYKNEPPAAEEVSRWKEAGFVAAVVESNNYFSVALGRYATISEARFFAEQMWEAFENGYFIGRMRIL